MKKKIALIILGITISFSVFCFEVIPTHNLQRTIINLIDEANDHIKIAHFIFNNDSGTNEILSHLIRKKRENPKIKIQIIADAIGGGPIFPFSVDFLKSLGSEGIDFKIFNSKMKVFNAGKRMHDKIILIDDRAIIGSSGLWNMSFRSWLYELDLLIDEQDLISEIKRHYDELWKSRRASFEYRFSNNDECSEINKEPFCFDTAKIIGRFLRETDREVQASIYQIYPQERRGAPIKVEKIEYVHESPVKDKDHSTLSRISNLLGNAKREITIVNPYFLLTNELYELFSKISARNVSINIITNNEVTLAGELPLVGIEAKNKFTTYSNLKLNIWQTRNIFLHARFIIIDNEVVYIGSTSFDSLSQNYNTENGVVIHQSELSDSLLGIVLENEIEYLQQKSDFVMKKGVITNSYVESCERGLCSSLNELLTEVFRNYL